MVDPAHCVRGHQCECGYPLDLPDFVLTERPALVSGTATPDSPNTAFALPSTPNSGDHTGKQNGHGSTSTLSPAATHRRRPRRRALADRGQVRSRRAPPGRGGQVRGGRGVGHVCQRQRAVWNLALPVLLRNRNQERARWLGRVACGGMRAHIAVGPARGTRRPQSARRRLGAAASSAHYSSAPSKQVARWPDVKRRFTRRWCTASLSRRGSHAPRRVNGPGCVR